MQKYEKKYDSVQEYLARYQIFKRNIEEMSKVSNDELFQNGINQFSDMTKNEFRRKYLNLNISIKNTFRTTKLKYTPKLNTPDNFDWENEGAVTPVKNQGSCGSCWAFCTVANLEGLYFIKHKELLRFSEQQLVDCDTLDEGCNGGLMENSFEWIKQNGGLCLEDDYQYKGYEGTCNNSVKKVVKVIDWTLLDSMDEEVIKDYLYNTGPLAVALNADTLQYYSSGIISSDSSACDPAGMNHGVTITGYGVENGIKYWKVKNSWGSSWGENGYFRILRGKGTCGINTYITSATIA
jgi:C1A family cysteine protease